jgi:hypothetical protein
MGPCDREPVTPGARFHSHFAPILNKTRVKEIVEDLFLFTAPNTLSFHSRRSNRHGADH